MCEPLLNGYFYELMCLPTATFSMHAAHTVHKEHDIVRLRPACHIHRRHHTSSSQMEQGRKVGGYCLCGFRNPVIECAGPFTRSLEVFDEVC